MKHAIALKMLLFFSFFCDLLGIGNNASRSMARIKNNLDRRIAAKEYDEHYSYAEHTKPCEISVGTLENNKPFFYAKQSMNIHSIDEANFAVGMLATFVLGACVARSSGKTQAEERQITHRLSEEELFHQMIQQNYAQELSDKNDLVATINEQYELCSDYDFAKQHLESRVKTLDSIDRDKLSYQYQNHYVSAPVSNLLARYGLNKNLYANCYGNQLQQELHEECLSILENTAALSISCPLYDYKPELVGLANGAREYNQQGLSRKAIIVLDVCWSLLDYGTAIVEGLAQGVLDAAQSIVDHPVQTTLCLIAGEYVLAYQLSKMLVEVAQIGLISCIDRAEGSARWQEYIEPLHKDIEAIANKEFSVRSCIKTTAYCAASYMTQHKVLCTSISLYQKAKNKALEFAKNNPLFNPAQYIATPEGLVLKAVTTPKKLSWFSVKKEIKNCIEKKNDIINDTCNAVLKNGYYEVNGFKFSKHYYEKLWSGKGGRSAPSLVAGEILNYSKVALPDHKPGFFRYEVSDWEMIYNPITKEVWHLQPLRNKK